ncbi:MAG: hypothetical protein A3B38_01075 [Candidatus Levybacteria bacterium RIFCSPLOWO2_01_FULL_36_13]|nr:MAG: hypothetical protein A2684_02315 [Candidatus Levybacteria bacterium RIFCSPHIGHO2_01_FULL_36_15b]OGH35479.1 MAG: hypothetical protein A3B38_01075 [Candidatus Levybacteria bacterium RIFCSPLOWO2_01_FULL_36_13]
MINIERQTDGIQHEAEFSRKLSLLFGHIKEEAKNGLKNYGQFYPGEVGSPTFRYEFDEDTNEAVFEIEQNDSFFAEVRRYFISDTSIRKEGHRDGPGRFIKYTKEEYDLEEGEFKAEPLQVGLRELDILAKLVLSPLENYQELESLRHLPY